MLSVNSWWPSDAMWLQCTGTLVVHVIACCLFRAMLNQCWPILNVTQWQFEYNFFLHFYSRIYLWKIVCVIKAVPAIHTWACQCDCAHLRWRPCQSLWRNRGRVWHGDSLTERHVSVGINTSRHGKMDDILQTATANTFSGMKRFKFRLKFHWSFFLWID